MACTATDLRGRFAPAPITAPQIRKTAGPIPESGRIILHALHSFRARWTQRDVSQRYGQCGGTQHVPVTQTRSPDASPPTLPPSTAPGEHFSLPAYIAVTPARPRN